MRDSWAFLAIERLRGLAVSPSEEAFIAKGSVFSSKGYPLGWVIKRQQRPSPGNCALLEHGAHKYTRRQSWHLTGQTGLPRLRPTERCVRQQLTIRSAK